MSILDQIIATKIEEVALASASLALAELRAQALQQPPGRGFVRAISACPAPAIIAEIKRASPSRGMIREDLNPVDTAIAYATHGAQAISVLTDSKYFGGSIDFLRQIRTANIHIPLLRKDFIISPYQIWEARLAGADAVLLIAAALHDEELIALSLESTFANLDILLEAHDENELERALRLMLALKERSPTATLPLLGINNRDLRSFVTDLAVTEHLGSILQSMLSQKAFRSLSGEIIMVTESGISKPEDLSRLLNSGAHAFLVGESLVASGEPGHNLQELVKPFRPAGSVPTGPV